MDGILEFRLSFCVYVCADDIIIIIIIIIDRDVSQAMRDNSRQHKKYEAKIFHSHAIKTEQY